MPDGSAATGMLFKSGFLATRESVAYSCRNRLCQVSEVRLHEMAVCTGVQAILDITLAGKSGIEQDRCLGRKLVQFAAECKRADVLNFSVEQVEVERFADRPLPGTIDRTRMGDVDVGEAEDGFHKLARICVIFDIKNA